MSFDMMKQHDQEVPLCAGYCVEREMWIFILIWSNAIKTLSDDKLVNKYEKERKKIFSLLFFMREYFAIQYYAI